MMMLISLPRDIADQILDLAVERQLKNRVRSRVNEVMVDLIALGLDSPALTPIDVQIAVEKAVGYVDRQREGKL